MVGTRAYKFEKQPAHLHECAENQGRAPDLKSRKSDFALQIDFTWWSMKIRTVHCYQYFVEFSLKICIKMTLPQAYKAWRWPGYVFVLYRMGLCLFSMTSLIDYLIMTSEESALQHNVFAYITTWTYITLVFYLFMAAIVTAYFYWRRQIRKLSASWSPSSKFTSLSTLMAASSPNLHTTSSAFILATTATPRRNRDTEMSKHKRKPQEIAMKLQQQKLHRQHQHPRHQHHLHQPPPPPPHLHRGHYLYEQQPHIDHTQYHYNYQQEPPQQQQFPLPALPTPHPPSSTPPPPPSPLLSPPPSPPPSSIPSLLSSPPPPPLPPFDKSDYTSRTASSMVTRNFNSNTSASSERTPQNNNDWYQKLTNTSFTLGERNEESVSFSDPDFTFKRSSTRCYFQLCWLLYETLFVSAISVGSIYLIELLPQLRQQPERRTVSFADIGVNCINSLLIFSEVFICAYPVRLLHVIYPIIYAISYIVFSLAYWSYDTEANVIYPSILNWNNPGLTAAQIVLLVFVVIPLLNAVHFGLYHLRLFIYRQIYMEDYLFIL
eukprot:XP_014784699.1 PREDICTED: uncharacterized protein LOC106879579 [Octopus bimaculoides]